MRGPAVVDRSPARARCPPLGAHEHCADVGRDPAQIMRTVQIWYGDSADKPPEQVEEYARVGVGEVVVVIRGGNAVNHAESVAALLPELRQI